MTIAEIDKLSIDNEVKKRLKMLKQSPVMFANVALLPTETAWVIPTEMLERQMRELFSTYLDAREIQDVAVWREAGSKNAPKVIIWMRSDCKHLVEKNEKRDDQMISPTVDRFSEPLKQLCDQFAPIKNDRGEDISRKKRIQLVRAQHDSGLTGVIMDFIRVMNRMFDVNNKGFIAVFGKDSPTRGCTIGYNPIFDRRDGGKIIAFKVTKKYADQSSGDRRPKPSFRDKNRDTSGGFDISRN